MSFELHAEMGERKNPTNLIKNVKIPFVLVCVFFGEHATS
jgi:hypothetical protein